MSERTSSPSTPPTPEEHRHARAARTAARARAAVTGAVSLIAAALGVLFVLVPSLKPLPRDKIDASMQVADLENFVSVGRWAGLQFPGHPQKRLRRILGHAPSHQDEAERGSVLYVLLRTEGFKHRAVKLRATLYNADTRTPSQNSTSGIEFPQTGRLNIDAPSRSSLQLVFVQDVTILDGRFFFRVEAYDKSGILAYADSPTFVHGKLLRQPSASSKRH